MGYAAAIDGELLDHAVAVEPVAVAPAEPVVDRRPVAEEAALQPCGPCAGNGERPGIQPVRRRLPAEQHRVAPEGSGEGPAPVVAGRGERRCEGCEAGQSGGGGRSEEAAARNAAGGHRLLSPLVDPAEAA